MAYSIKPCRCNTWQQGAPRDVTDSRRAVKALRECSKPRVKHIQRFNCGIQQAHVREVSCCATQLATSAPKAAHIPQLQPQQGHTSETLQQTIARLQQFVSQLSNAQDWDAKLNFLRRHDRVQSFAASSRRALRAIESTEKLSAQHACMVLCLPIIGQEHVLLAQPAGDVLPALLRLAEALAQVDRFFGSLGGLPWYHLRCLRFIDEANPSPVSPAAHLPQRVRDSGAVSSSSRLDQPAADQPCHCHGTRSALNGISAMDAINSIQHQNKSSHSDKQQRHLNGSGSFDSLHGAIDVSYFKDTDPTKYSRQHHAMTDAPARANGAPAAAGSVEASEQQLHMPKGIDLQHDAQAARRAVAHGLQAVPYLAEIYPIGGAGDRLGLIDEDTGEHAPTAMLPYCGRTLLEGLLRDLQAREHLHWRLTGRQVVTPVSLMTSDAKGNHRRIAALLDSLSWLGRGEDTFRLFRQPMVPVVGTDGGRWPLGGPLAPMMKPGGHGAIWKLMLDNGIFDWLAAHHRDAAIVRQISNPLAGSDDTLLALAGTGYMGGKLFGFASCPRAVGASEGMNVLSERKISMNSEAGATWQYEYGITNIEYTEFKRLGIKDEARSEGSQLSVFPANTNVLYLSLKAAEGAVREGAAAGGGAMLPGLIFNGSKTVEEPSYLSDHTSMANDTGSSNGSHHGGSNGSSKGGGGESRTIAAGRLESTMQNLVDSLAQRFPTKLAEGRHHELRTFAVFNKRRKVTSSAKRRRREGSLVVAQTPDGSFRDLMGNARELLLGHCSFQSVPEVGEVAEYLKHGPGFIFLFHPALGPLWDVIGQKLRGGKLAERAEVVLEVGDADVENLHVDGSLLVTATSVLGHFQAASSQQRPHGSQQQQQPPPPQLRPTSLDSLEGLYYDGSWAQGIPSPEYRTASPPGDRRQPPGSRLKFSSRCGRVRLTNVTVCNAGIDWGSPDNVFWRHQVKRKEAARIMVHGNAEFEARDVTLSGDCSFSVPDGHRMLMSPGVDGDLSVSLEALSDGQPTWGHNYEMASDGRICVSRWTASKDRRRPNITSIGQGCQLSGVPTDPRQNPPKRHGPDAAAFSGQGSSGSIRSDLTDFEADKPNESDPSWFSSQL